MKRFVTSALTALIFSISLYGTPAYAQRGDRPPPPPGHELRSPPPPDARWERGREPPPYWNDRQWSYRQRYLRRHNHNEDDHSSAEGLVAGVILGFILGAAVADTQERQTYAQTRLDDQDWTENCRQRYRSFDPYSGTYLGYDGLRHYCH